MKYPHYEEIELPLLRFIFEHGGDVHSSECYRPMGICFGLSEPEMTRTFIEVQGYGEDRPKWPNMVRWARNSLAKAGLVERPTGLNRGRWKLTEKWIKKAAEILENKLPINYPDEVSETVVEGAKKQVLVNLYERRATARDKCIDH